MQTSSQQQIQNQNRPQETKTVTLKASDGPLFDVTEAVAVQMGIVKSFLEENGGDIPDAAAVATTIMPFSIVDSSNLVKVIEYCTRHHKLKGDSAPEDQVRAFDSGFINDLSNEQMKGMLVSANYLDVKGLLELLVVEMANRIKNKSIEFVRKLFGIDNDFSSQEEAKLRAEYAWAFEDMDQD